MATCLFEDVSISTLLPLTHVNPDFDLRSGIFTMRERLLRYFEQEPLQLFTRMGLAPVVAERSGLAVNVRSDTDLFVSGSAVLRPDLVHRIREHRGEDRVFVHEGRLLAATVVSAGLREKIFDWLTSGLLREELVHHPGILPDLERFEADVEEVQTAPFTFPWELLAHNTQLLLDDADFFPLGQVEVSAELAASAELFRKGDIYIGADARVGPGAVLDASDGPVIIDAGAVIMPQALVMGPAYIGLGSRIKAGAKIYEGSTVGPVCKVGGEVEETIFHSYANKQHDGFVGHSYFAPWTNVGADSNTSDLKNNYSRIRVTLEGRGHDTGLHFLGTIMADHSKCGINTMFNTGTVVGVGCNVFGGDFPPKFLPSFSWGGATGVTEHDFQRFAETASVVMQRRNKALTDAERHLLHEVFVHTAGQRSSAP
ncbi:MAG: putative sugar nucleotidyl transferase [Bacteroidota bacterium]|nr:putative sugar nucleotidyl transferase [Bacteroidota bacterium]